jgi:hypothetical protein
MYSLQPLTNPPDTSNHNSPKNETTVENGKHSNGTASTPVLPAAQPLNVTTQTRSPKVAASPNFHRFSIHQNEKSPTTDSDMPSQHDLTGKISNRGRNRAKATELVCALCGRSYKYRNSHFKKFHASQMGRNEWDLANREAFTSHAIDNPVGGVFSGRNGAGLTMVEALRAGERRQTDGTEYEGGEEDDYDDDYDDREERIDDGEAPVGEIVRRSTGSGLMKSPYVGNGSSFRAVNQPVEESPAHIDEMAIKLSAQESARHPSSNGVSRSHNPLKRPYQSNGTPLTPSGASFDGMPPTKRRILNRTESPERKQQWEKLLEAIRIAPELPQDMKSDLILDLFKEQIKHIGSLSSPRLHNNGRGSSVGTQEEESPIHRGIAPGD